MHWFLVEQSSTNLKNILNICMYKLSFCYLSHENFHEFSLEVLYKYIKLKMILQMENFKFEVKRVTHFSH